MNCRLRLAQFTRLDTIGRGTFAVIYSARDNFTGRLFAIKEMAQDMKQDQHQQAFNREVEILAKMSHYTILLFRGYVPIDAPWGDPPVIVTEFMANGSLQKFIDAERKGLAPPNWSETGKFIIAYGIATGMWVLHSRRVIHRDLKPDNVLLSDDMEPKIADFGLSKFSLGGGTNLQTITGGTSWYMAPEIFEGVEFGFPVDVYAYGVLIFVLMTARNPWPVTESLFAHGCAVKKGQRPPIPDFIGTGYKALIESCWDGSPARRPTFEQILMELGKESFLNTLNIDIDQFLDYQAKIVPEEIRSPHATPAPRSPQATPAPRSQHEMPAPRSPPRKKTRIEQLLEDATRGDPFAQNEYGMYCRERGDIDEAAVWFKKSAEGGNVCAMVNIASCLMSGSGCDQNVFQAALWYSRAAAKGDVGAMYQYAKMLEEGLGVGRNMKAAIEHYVSAANAGNPKAQQRVGRALEFGHWGLQRNFSEAVRFYKMSSDQGDPQGMFDYADMLENAKGVPRNIMEAIRLYQLAAEKGHGSSTLRIALFLIKGEHTPKNTRAGRTLVERAVELGADEGHFILGQMEEEGVGGPKNLRTAFAHYKAAAQAGVWQAELRQAEMLADGIGCEKSPKAAEFLFTELLQTHESAEAMLGLGILKLQGEGGVEKNREFGVKLIREAARRGNSKAQRVLNQLQGPTMEEMLGRQMIRECNPS